MIEDELEYYKQNYIPTEIFDIKEKYSSFEMDKKFKLNIILEKKVEGKDTPNRVKMWVKKLHLYPDMHKNAIIDNQSIAINDHILTLFKNFKLKIENMHSIGSKIIKHINLKLEFLEDYLKIYFPEIYKICYADKIASLDSNNVPFDDRLSNVLDDISDTDKDDTEKHLQKIVKVFLKKIKEKNAKIKAHYKNHTHVDKKNILAYFDSIEDNCKLIQKYIFLN